MSAPSPPPASAPPPADDARASGRSPHSLVIGVLGGIASGKSTVAALLAGPDGLVLSADRIAHEVLASPPVVERLRERFGEEVLDASGAPDREALARRVFDPVEGPAHRRALEGWTHPRVRATISRRLEEARAAGTPRIVLDVPLLLENDAEHGWVEACDVLVFVDVPLEERRRRAAERGWSRGDLERREAAQLPLDQKRARADHVLRNDGDRATLEERVRALSSTLAAG